MSLILPHRTLAFKADGVALLSDTVASVCCQLDATIEASYGGSGQTWSNVTPSPADSSAKGDWDAHLGLTADSSSDDPFFTGSVGDAAAYFALDGGDFFTLKTFINATTLANAHKQGGAYWIAMPHRVASGASQSPWGSGNVGNTDIGIKGQTDHDGFRRLFHYDGTSQAQNGESNSNNDYDEGDDILLIFSMDMTSDTNNIRAWTVSTTSRGAGVTRLSTTDAASGNFHIGATQRNSSPDDIMSNGTRVYGFAVGNIFLTDSISADIYAYYETLHGRDYTP